SDKHQLYECLGENINPYQALPEVSKYWTNISNTNNDFWEAPKGLFWICGKTVYVKLPGKWAGSCTIGAIKPSFFLLPKKARPNLGVPL
ncbi:ENR1 protein, partial [Picathartes gymnocephalus]|nr:ENR1 protein [Picathartes gymnocephalus]